MSQNHGLDRCLTLIQVSVKGFAPVEEGDTKN